MVIAQHRTARTKPAVRTEIAASAEPACILAQRYGIAEQTVCKWQKRHVFTDRSRTRAAPTERTHASARRGGG